MVIAIRVSGSFFPWYRSAWPVLLCRCFLTILLRTGLAGQPCCDVCLSHSCPTETPPVHLPEKKRSYITFWMVNWPGPTECRRSSTQREPECSGRHTRAGPQTRLGMSSLDRRHQGGRTAKQGQIKYADGFMDETDREVSSLTDRAFRSLCVGEEAAYTDPELTSSPRDAFAVELPATFQHSFIDSQDQGPRYVSQLSNGAIEAMWQNRRSRSRVSSLIKAFSSSEGGSTMDGAPDGRRSNPDGWTWESSALLSLNNELSNFPAYCRDPFTPAASLQASHLGPASASSKTLRNKVSKATFRKLSSINYFLHSEHSPFQTWADYNRIPCQREATPPTLSPTGFHRWYDSPLYKELTASHGIQTTHSEDVKSYWMLSKDRTPSELARSVIQPKPAAVEKRCESEVLSKCPPWRKSRNQLSNQLPVYRPSTASPCSHASRRHDDASFSGSRPSAVHHQVHTLVGEQTAGSCTPFSISQLLTPVLNARQEMETSEVSQYELSPADDLAALRDAEPCSPPELKLRDSYKAMASSLLFNLKDNRKRVKSTYSPTKFKGLELSDSDNLPCRQDNAALASKKSASGPPGPGISTNVQTGAAEACSVYSPALQPTKASAADHKKYTEANRLDDYFTLISPPNVKEAPLYSNSDRITQESTQQIDKVFVSQQSQYRHSQHLPSTSNESLSRNKSNQPTWKEYKTSPTEQLSTGGPTGSTTVTYSLHERRNSFSVKEKDVIRRDELLHNKMDTTQSLAAFKKHDTGQEVRENRNSPNTDAFNLCENVNVRSTRSSLKADELVQNKPSSQILQVQKWGGTTQGIHALKEKIEADTGSHTSTERQNTTHRLFPQKESEHSRIAMNEIKEKGHIRQGVLKIQVNDPDSHSVPANCQNLQDLSIGTMNRADGQTAKIPPKGLNELSSSGLYTVQNDEPATKHTHSLKERKHVSGDMLPKPEGPTEKSASQRNEELPDQGQKSVGYSSNRKTTSDNYSNYTQAKPRAGQHATGLKLPESDTTAATEQDHMKNEHPSEDHYWAKQSEQMTNEEILNKRHPSVRKTRGEKMLAQNSIKASTEYELRKGQGSDDPETDGQENRERFIMNAVRKNDGFVQERRKSYQESHAATEQEVNGSLKEQGARENKHIKSKQPDAIDEKVFSRMESHPVGNGEAIIGGNDLARCMLAEKCNKHNGLANKDNHKVKHRIFTFNQRDHAMQELLTSKVKAHAQKEIIAIKEKGHAKREGIISSRKDSRERVNDGQRIANQGVAIASENWDMKAETPPRECSRTDTLPKIKENEAPQTEVKQGTPASQGSQEWNRTAPFAKKEGAGNAGLHGKKNTINDRQELLQTGNLHIQKASNDIKETYSKQDLKQKHDTCISEKKQDPADKEVHENRVGDKQELLSVDSGRAETVAVNSQAEVTPADKQKDITIKKVLSYGEKGHTLNKNASLGGIPKASLELSARTTEESDIPHKDRLTNNKQPKHEGLQYKNKEHTQNEATITDKYYPSDQGKFPTENENPAEVCTLPNIGSTNEKPHKGLLKEKESVNEGDRMELGTKEECSTVVAASMQKVQDGKEDKSTGTPMRNVQDKTDDKSTGTTIRNVQDKRDDKSMGTTIRNVQDKTDDKSTGTPMRNVQDKTDDKSTGTTIRNVQDKTDDKSTGTTMRNVQDKTDDKSTGTPMRNIQDKTDDKSTGTPMRNVQVKTDDKSTGTPMRNIQDKTDDKSTGTPMRNVQDKTDDKSTGTPMRNIQDKTDDKSTGTPMRNIQDKTDDKSMGTSMRNVQSRKEVLGTIENEFVKINVFAITRKVDTEWEDPSSKRNNDNTMHEITERGQMKEETVTYTVGSENASRINNQTVKTAGEGKGHVKQELPTKQNCPTSEAITVEEFSKPDIKRPMEHDIQGGNATKEITKPVVLKAEEQSKIVPLVKHEHTFPAMLSTVSPTSADHTQLETLGKEDSPARKDLQPQKFPKVPTTVEGIEDSMYAKSRHDKQMVFEEQPAEPEIIRTIKSSKPFKRPATENPKFDTDRIKLNMSPEVLAKKEDHERNLCYTHNDSTELQTFATKDHTKVLMSAAEDHKSDGHNQAHAFSAEEYGRKSGRKSPKSDVFEMKELTKSGSQGHITTYDSKRPATNVQEHNKSSVHVESEITQPGVCVKPEDSKPSELATSEHPKPEVHTKKDTAVFTEHITLAAHLMREHSKHVKPEDSKPVTMEHPKPGVGLKPENSKPDIPVPNEHPKPGVRLKSEHSKPGVLITTDHPKPDVAVTTEHPKPVLRVKSEHSKTGIQVTAEYPKPGVPRTVEHQKPDIHVKSEDGKPGLPVTTEPSIYVKPGDSKPNVSVSGEHSKPSVPKRTQHPKPVTKEHTKPGTPVTTEHPKPGVPIRREHPNVDIPVKTEHPKPGVPIRTEHPKLDIPVTTEHTKPGLCVKSEHSKPGLFVTTEHPTPGVRLTAEHSKPGVPVTTQHSTLDTPVTIEHLTPGLRVKSKHSKTGVAVTTEHPKPVTHITAEQPKPRVPITEHLKPDMHVTPEDSKPGLPVTAKHPKLAVPKTTEHPKPDVPLTKEHPTPNVPVTIENLKPGLHVKSEHSKTVVPVTKDHPKPGLPVSTEHPKPDEPAPMEHPNPVSRAKSEASKSSVPVTTEHFKPLRVTTEHPKPDEPVTKDHLKPGAAVTTDHLKPVLRIKSEGSKPSIPVTTEHFKSGVPVTTEHPKPGIHVTREDSKAGVPVITEHPKPVVCVKQEYSKPHEPVTTDLKPGAPVPKEHTKKGIPVKAEQTKPALEYTKPVVSLLKEEALTNEHPKAPLRRERHKPNVHVQKEHHELEPLCKESGNLEMLVKLKGFTSDRVLINNCIMEPAKSEVHATKDSAEAKPKDFSHLGNSHLEMKKDPTLVPEEKGQISKHTFPSKEHTKTKMGVLTDKEDLNKVRDMHTWMERDQVISMKELESKEDFTGRQGNSGSDKQPIYVETPKKPLNELYLSVQEAQQTPEQKLKIRNSPGNTGIIQQRENKEEMEGLQYYAITNHDTEVQAKGALLNSSQKTEMALRTREMENSGRVLDDGRWTHNTTYPAQAPVLSPLPDTSSPSLGKPTLFKVKDNTFKTSPVTKTVKPYFHKTFPEDLQLSSPIGSEKGEDWHDANSEETKVIQHAVGLSNRFQQPKEHSPRSALFPSDSTATKEPHGYFRKNPALEEDECCSIGSALSEESCAAGTADVTNDRAGILGVTEGPEIVRGISERPEPTCSVNEGKTFGKPPVVPLKTEKALRRAQKLTTRRIKKAEGKVRPEGTWHLDQTSLRMVSSEPPSPTGQLLSQHLAPSPNAAPRYCMDPGYVPSAPKLVAQPFPLTERKLLQDPNSGQYFMVEVPVPVKTKTFFDPETGKYIQLSVRQSPEGTLSPASSVELLTPPYLLYPGFLTLPVASVPPLRSSSQMSAPAALAEDQEMLELNDPWVQKGYCPELGQDSQMYIEPVYMQHEQPQEPTLTESKSSQRKLNIISMSELEDFAVEST
ncbi:cardiac-enriched FHL2-interacting protein isoform X2 [Paramormyrops kingsleyae]|uniref:cardiac-enriched FHL2-interacting protein isoform X2 n=1 Tax=Paramormyrops kingsleyae TaxID=1676925 RepID=UPI003B96DBF5